MTFSVREHANSTQVTSSDDHDKIARLKLDEIDNLARLDVELDGVVDLDERIGIANGATVVSHDIGDAFLSNFESLDTAKFVLEERSIRITLSSYISTHLSLFW